MAVQINVAANQAALTASIQAGVQAYNQKFAQSNQINLSINQRGFSQPLGRITGDVKDFEAALAASNARVIAFGASTAVLGGVIRSFKELANVTIEVEKNLADINRVFGLTTSQLQKFSTDLFNVTKLTASSFDDASKAALEFSRQGLKAEDTLQRTKDALTLTRLAGISTANAVDALTSTVNGFAATGISTTQILNKLVAVEQDYAVGAGDLAEALSRTGQAAQEAGVSLDQLNALVTSAQQSTARGGAVIGNALKTIFTRLQRTDTLDQLEAFNISVRDVQGNILPAVQILQNFAGAYKGLADAQRAQLSEQVAGVYQVNILKAIVNDLNKSQGTYAGALQRGAAATNEAEVATAKLNQTLDALLKQTATSTQQLANNIGKVTFEPLAKYGTEQLKSFVESMNEVLEGEGVGSTFANGLLKGIRNVIAGPGAIAAFFTLFKLIQNSFTYLSQALPQIAGITTETQNRKNIEQSILQIMQQQGPVSQALAGTMGNQAAQAQLLLQLARQQTAEYQMQTTLAKQLAVQLAGQGVRVKGSGGLQVTRAGGYIPNATKMAEVVGAQAGGYTPGRVVSSPVGGVMNTAEDVKYIPGFAQPFINPPAGSKAGRAHRQNAINRTGVDPYAANGFLPNFAIPQVYVEEKYDDAVRGKTPNKSRNSYSLNIDGLPSDRLNADLSLDFKGTKIDAGYSNADEIPTRNKYFDQIYGQIKIVKFLEKEMITNAVDSIWEKVVSGKNDYSPDDPISKLLLSPDLTKQAFNRALLKNNISLLDLRDKYNRSIGGQGLQDKTFKTVKTKRELKTPKDFQESLFGDKNNFIGSFYEGILLNNLKGYVLADNEYSAVDLVGDKYNLSLPPLEAKGGQAELDQLIRKGIRSSSLKADDKTGPENFGGLVVVQPYGSGLAYNSGFIPNFSPIIDDNYFDKHAFPGGTAIGPIPDKAIQNILDRQRKRQMTYLDFDRTLVRTMGDIAYAKVSPDQKKGVLQKMFLDKEARLKDVKGSKLTQFGELLRQKIQQKIIDPGLLGLMTASDETPGMPEYISSIWGIPKRNQVYSAKPGTKEAKLASLGVSANGFIPNFAPPTSAIRIPWFKKFGNPAFDAIQPALGISKASDTETFRQINFKSTAEGADERGDSNIFAPLFEDFAFKAMQLVSQPDVKNDLIRGYVLQPKTNQKQSAFDAALEEAGVGIEYKGYPKKNLPGSITGELTRKYETLSKSNPAAAAKLKELIIAFNEVGHENQITSELGKKLFGPLAGTSYSEMVKNSPDLVKGLSAETDSLLNSYVKNPAFLAMAAANGFVPNFGLIGDRLREAYTGSSEKTTNEVVPFVLDSNGKIYSDGKDVHHEQIVFKNKIKKWIRGYYGISNSKTQAPSLNFSTGSNDPSDKIFSKYTSAANKLSLLDKLKSIFTKAKTVTASQKIRDSLITFNSPDASNLFSKGFIPNFAYKQAVMGLEESMSGNKAIFDTKPFPHIRNSSQPTFSSAIADHGGLSNALSDSMRGQKAAGLMSGGFIPNFVNFGSSYPYMPSGTPSGSSAYYPSGNPNASQRVSPIYAPQQSNVSGRAGNSIFNNNDIEKATQGFVDTVQKADAKLSIFERIFGGRNKLIDSELLKLKTTLSNNGVQGQALSDAMNKASKIIQSEPSKFAKNLASAGTAISLTGPMIAGLAEQAFFGNKERTDLTENERMGKSALSTGLSAISTGVGIGASFGPLGSAIGGTVGALIGLTSSLDAARLSADELMQLSEKQSQKAQENIQASSSYIESQKQLTDLISKGASSTEIETATENLAKNFNLIKDTKLQEIFLSAGGNVDVMTQQLKQYTEQVVKQGARERGLFGDKMTLNERTSALTVGIGREKLPSFIEDLKRGVEDAREAYTNFDDEVGAFQKDAARNRARREGFIPAAKKILKDQGYQETDTNYQSQLNQLLEVLDTTAENLIKSLNESLNIIDLSKIFANFNKKATESYSAIFERIANNLQNQNFDLERRFISATGENKIQNTILEFSTGFNSFLDSFLSDTLDEFSKLQMAPQVATRKYTEGLNKIQLNNNKFQIDQEKAKNDFLEKNASKLTDTFKSSILQSQQNAQYFESTLLPQIQQGNYNFDLSRVLKDLNQQNLDQAKRTISESGIQGLETLDLTSAGGRELGLKILTNEAKTLGEGSEKAAEKIAAAVNAINSLSKSADFLTNTNAQKSVGYALKTATQEKTNFDANQKYLEEENRIRSSFEAARLKAETDLAVKRAEVDKGILLRLRAMRELVDELQVRSAISAARGSAQAQLTEARVQDPFRILGQGIRSNTEETIRLENQAIQERRKVEDATLNDQIQQAAIEIATREANTTALEGLTNAVFELTNNILMQQMGGQSNYENIKSFQNSYPAIPINPEDKNTIYTPEQISAFKAYQQLQQQRPSSLGGYNFSEYKKQLSEINPNRKLTQDQITGISKNFQSRAKELGVTENEANRLMEDQQTLSIYQQLETIRNKALESKTKESDKIAEDARALQNRLIKEKDILGIQRDIGDQIKKNADEYKRMQSTFSGNFVIGVANLRTQSEEIINNLGRDLPRMFGDGLVDGIKAAIRESDNLGDALMGIASKFLDEISTAMMRSAIYGILGNIGMGIPGISNAAAAGGMKQKGGYIRAQSGMYISGTGSGDKYPALLENGEYVLNRRAVMAMGGPAALDTLNFSAAPRFAAGGSFGNNFSDISSMESNMTTYGLEQSQLYNELRDSERQKQQEGIRKRQQRKAERNAMIGSIIAAVATAAIAAGVSNVASNVKATNAQKLSAKFQATGGASLNNSELGKLASYQKSGLLGKNFEYIGGTPQTGFGSVFSGPTIGKTWYQKAGSSITKPFGRRQAGGYIGSRLSDTIPAYATGGLVDMPIVKRYAVGGNVSAQRINNGAGNNSTVNNNTSASNSFNFNTTVQRDGKIEIGSNMTSYSQQDVELSQSLNTKVYEVVLDTIRKEKRFGGSLAGTRNA